MPRLPALERLLARGEHRPAPHPGGTLEAALCNAFGLYVPPDNDLPVAALTAASDLAQQPDGVWARVDPVNLRPDMAKLLLFADDHLPLTLNEARAIADHLNAELAADGLCIQVGNTASRWYMQLPDPAPRLKTNPPYMAHGQHIDPYLPSGPDATLWNRHINTVQMLLHMESVNTQRETTGLLPVNSLWLWGVGALPAATAVRWTDVLADDALARGLALMQHCAVHPLPRSAAQLELGERTCALVQPVALHGKQWHQGTAAWQAHLSALDQHWLAPLLQQLQQGRTQELTLLTEQVTIRVTRKDLRRFWQRSKPLHHYLL